MQMISIIVPLYKGNIYVKKIIEMINSNTKILKNSNLSFDVELIFINDYPEEKIECDIFNDYDFKIRLISNETNLGIHDSRVVGIENSNGKYIYMLDQDDHIEDDFLLSQMSVLEKNNNAPFVVSNGYIEHKTYNRLIYESRIMQWLAKKTIAYAYLDNRIISPGQCIIKKECIPDFWKNHALKKNGADDMLLWLLLLKDNKPVINAKRVYTHVNTDKNTSLDFAGMYSSVDEMLDLIKNANDDLGIKNKIINIIEYRNSYLKREIPTAMVSPLTKALISSIYAARRIKNGGKQ